MNPHSERTASPWRNPMVWLMVGLPSTAVVAGIATLVIAMRAGGGDVISEEVQRTAQIQTTELGPDERAAALKLSAVLSVHNTDGAATLELLPASGVFVDGATAERRAYRARPLRLLLQHPTRAAEDRELRLLPTATGWRVDDALDSSHDWRLQVLPEGGAWRLRARLPAGQRGVLLTPSVGVVPSGAVPSSAVPSSSIPSGAVPSGSAAASR
jgi:uncharacterized protein